MAGPSTRRALGRRAIGTAGLLEDWAKRLEDEMRKQNILLHRQPQSTLKKAADDSLMPVSLTRKDIRRLIDDMHQYAAEIRRFSN